MPAASFLPALTLYRQDAVQGSGGDPQPLRDGNIVLHALIHGITADHQHMGTTEVVTRHVDAVLMLLGDAVRQEQHDDVGEGQDYFNARVKPVDDRFAGKVLADGDVTEHRVHLL